MRPLPTTEAGSHVRSLAIIGGLFFVTGLFTWLNGPLITFVRLAFDLDDVNAFLILMVFYISYFLFALPASWVHRRLGLKGGLAAGLVVMAVGSAVFAEFATRRVYPGALAGLFTLGGGLALLQTAINPYVSILGPIESGAQRIALMGICNKFAGLLAPVILGVVVLNGLDALTVQLGTAQGATREHLLNAFASKIEVPYLIASGLLVLTSALVMVSPLPAIRGADANPVADAPGGKGITGLGFRQARHLWLGVVCLFLYVGVEVLAGDAIGAYGRGFGLPLEQVRFMTSWTLAAMLLGYGVGGLCTPRFLSQQAYLQLSAVLGIGLVIGAFMTRGYVSVGFVAALGFANAMIWPAVFPLAVRGLGRFTETGSAFLIMGIAGGAVIPQAFAVLKQVYNFQVVFAALTLPCYLFIYAYGRHGASSSKTT
jgi:glucose/galactose transporter